MRCVVPRETPTFSVLMYFAKTVSTSDFVQVYLMLSIFAYHFRAVYSDLSAVCVCECVSVCVLSEVNAVWYLKYMLSSCVCPSVRPSVRPSQAGTVPKRLNIGSRKQRRTISQRL